MGNGFNYSDINTEGIFYYFLAVACDSGASNMDAGANAVYILKEFLDYRNGVSAVGKVFRIKQCAVFVRNNALDGRGACIYADKGISLIALELSLFDLCGFMSFAEGIKLLIVIEQGLVECEISCSPVFFYLLFG